MCNVLYCLDCTLQSVSLKKVSVSFNQTIQTNLGEQKSLLSCFWMWNASIPSPFPLNYPPWLLKPLRFQPAWARDLARIWKWCRGTRMAAPFLPKTRMHSFQWATENTPLKRRYYLVKKRSLAKNIPLRISSPQTGREVPPFCYLIATLILEQFHTLTLHAGKWYMGGGEGWRCWHPLS